MRIALFGAALIGLVVVLSVGGTQAPRDRAPQSHLRSLRTAPVPWAHPKTISIQGPAGRATLRLFRTPTPASQPTELIGDGHGGYWFTEQRSDALGHVSPAGAIREYRVPTLHSQPFALALDGRGNVWFTELGSGKLGRVDRAGHVVEFSLHDGSAQPYAIALGPADKMWFTEYGADKVGNIDARGIVTLYRLPTKYASPAGIAQGADRNMWVAESGYTASRIAKVTPDGNVTEYPLPSAGAQPFGIAAHGRMLWVTEFAAGKVAAADLSGHVTEYTVPGVGVTPLRVSVTPTGNVWFTDPASDQIGEITVSGGRERLAEYALPDHAAALDVAPGPHDAVWTTQYLLDSVGVFTPTEKPRAPAPARPPRAWPQIAA